MDPVVLLLILVVHLEVAISLSSDRSARFWPPGFVRFQNGPCLSRDGRSGTCYTKHQCREADGTGAGTCARVGTCCIFQSTCGQTSSNNNTYFINPKYPNTETTTFQCTFTVQRCDSTICQLRLDFLNLILAQPDGNGNCVLDSLRISGGASNVPIICGENSGQHVYVDFNGDADIRITISLSGTVAIGRSWNIKATQIGCDCRTIAPSGCLMYYTGLTGTVSSFNYGTTLSGGFVTNPAGELRPGTRELSNLNYGVCIEMIPGYCSIRWSQTSDPYSFTVSGNTALNEVDPGLPADPLSGIDCTMDYVVIPNPFNATTAMPVGADRFCGNQFLPITTSSKPFVMTVVTDDNDMTDIANRGFTLNYEQLPCTMNFIATTT